MEGLSGYQVLQLIALETRWVYRNVVIGRECPCCDLNEPDSCCTCAQGVSA